MGDLPNKSVEPPVPPGLQDPSGALKNLAVFLRLDGNFLRVAAQNSQPLLKPTRKEILSRIAKMPVTEKNEILTRLVEGTNADSIPGLLQRYFREHGSDDGIIKKPMKQRTVGELRQAAEKLVAPGTAKRFVANKSRS